MRISRWPGLFCGLIFVAIAGQTANAFDPGYGSPIGYALGDDESDGSFEEPSYFDEADGVGFQPVQYVDEGYGAMPMYGGGDPYFMQGGYPPNAWPGVTPYTQHNMEGVYNDGGVWRYEANDDDRKHVFSTEMLITWGLRPGSHIIGDSQYTNVTFTNGLNSDRSQPDVSFPRQNSSQFSNLKHYGVKLRYGWENPDESGMMLSGFWVAPNDAVKGPGQVYNGDVTTLRGLASIAYNTAATGNLALFDESFSQTYDQEVWGADLDGYFAPFFRRQSFKMQALLGVKFLRISETYSIRGSASDYAYTVTNGDIDDGSVTQTGFPMLNTEINASAVSNLVGPQIGLRYDLGGERFKIWGQTKIAVAANMDTSKVFGRNALANNQVFPAGGGGLIIPPPPYNVTFNNTKSNTHVSPIFDQSIYGEFPLFSVLPILNRMSFINRANFRVGYNFLLVNDIQRPASLIVYQEADPQIRTHRTWFSLSTVSFSADWRF